MDNSTQLFIDKITKIKTGKDFEDTVKSFSRFLSFTNPDYKYNSTYLDQHIENFIKFKDSIDKKEIICNEIANKLSKQYNIKKCIFDNLWYFDFSDKDIQKEYLSIDYKTIIKSKINIKIYFQGKEKDNLFCKCYEIKKILYKEINDDLNDYMKFVKNKE